MKMNHETFRDNQDFGDNTFKTPTSLHQKPESTDKPEKKHPKLPKRTFTFGKETMFYLLHGLAILVSLLFGGLLGHVSLFLMLIPYIVVLVCAFRIGGNIRSKGLNHVLWNLSVLTSTYTNTNMRRMREQRTLLVTAGTLLMVMGSLFSGLFLIVGVILFLSSVVFFFAEQETDELAVHGKRLSWAMLVAGLIAFGVNPMMAHIALVLSLAGNWLYEKWKDYEWQVD